MSDLIERLRGADPLKLSLYTEAANEIERLQCENEGLRKELEKSKTIPIKYRRMEFNAKLQKENEDLRNKLITFNVAVDHVAPESGKTRRTFSTSEGWAMLHKDRLLDLECAEEELAALKAKSTEPVAWIRDDGNDKGG